VVLRIRVENTERHLLPGMYVRARVPQGGATEGILVPQAILRASDGLARVWVIDGSGKAHQKASSSARWWMATTLCPAA
jgi:multidrug efflux system membrane fusion protein